jgi:hypothetical protein
MAIVNDQQDVAFSIPGPEQSNLCRAEPERVGRRR